MSFERKFVQLAEGERESDFISALVCEEQIAGRTRASAHMMEPLHQCFGLHMNACMCAHRGPYVAFVFRK